MSAEGAIRAGRAFVEMGLDDAPLRKRLSAMRETFGRAMVTLGASVAGMGLAIATPMAMAVRSFEQVGSQLHDMAARTGVSVEALSMLRFAAGQTGTSIETVETGLRRMQVLLAGVSSGSAETAKVLGLVGLTIGQLRGLSPERQFAAIADGLRSIVDPSARAAAAVAIFGRGSGTALLPLIAEMPELAAEFNRLNLVISTETAAKADTLGDSFNLLGFASEKIKLAIGGSLAPVLTQLAKDMAEVTANVGEWVQRNPGLVTGLAGFAATAAIAGTALGTLGVAVLTIGPAFGAITAAIGAMLSPLALGVGAVAALGYAFVKYTEWGQASFDGLAGTVGEFVAYFRESFGAIGRALASGDLAAAGKVAMAELLVAWETTKLSLLNVWTWLGENMSYSINAVVYGAKSAWAEFFAWHKQQVATWAEFFAYRMVEIQGAFDSTFDVQRAKQEITQATIEDIGDVEADRAKSQQAIADAWRDSNAHAAGFGIRMQREAEAALEQAKAERDAAVAAANAVAAPTFARGPAFVPPDLEDALAQAARNVRVRGTFSAAVAGQIAGGDTFKRIEESNKRIADATGESKTHLATIARVLETFATVAI